MLSHGEMLVHNSEKKWYFSQPSSSGSGPKLTKYDVVYPWMISMCIASTQPTCLVHTGVISAPHMLSHGEMLVHNSEKKWYFSQPSSSGSGPKLTTCDLVYS